MKFLQKVNEAHIQTGVKVHVAQRNKLVMEYDGELKRLVARTCYYLNLGTKNPRDIAVLHNFIE